MSRTLQRPAISWLLVAAASLWLRTFFPIHAIGWASFDDALFIRLARSISHGHWLGPFDASTLTKGAFYPIFIAASFTAGIPLKLAEHAVYLAASALIAALTWSRTVATTLFVALAFVPILWTVDLSRVIREALYVGLSLATFGAAIAIGTAPNRREATWRGAGLGLLAGAFWLTREEGVWLLPSVLAIVALAGWRNGWRSLIRPLTAAALGWSILVGTNVALNRSAYGVAETVDVRSSAFKDAYGALSRIEHERWQHYVVFPRDARAFAYRVSPAAAELQPFFEGPGGEAWRQTGCRGLPGHDCAEILSPWFQWALRDAVAQAGHYDTARNTDRFYRRLAQEIDAACQSQQIACLPPRSTLAAPFRWSDLPTAVNSAGSLLQLLSTLGGNGVDIAPSSGTPAEIDTVADLVGPVARKPVPMLELAGRLTAASGTPLLRVQPNTPNPAWTTNIALDPPSFTLSTDCPPAACTLIVSLDGRDVATLPLATLAPHLQTPGVTLDIGRVRPTTLFVDSERRDRAMLAVARTIGRIYALLGPILLLTGVLGLLLTLLRRRDLVRTNLFALAAGSLIAVTSRIVLLAYVDATAMPSISLLYLSPAVPLAIVLAIGGTALLIASLRRRPSA